MLGRVHLPEGSSQGCGAGSEYGKGHIFVVKKWGGGSSLIGDGLKKSVCLYHI